MSIFLYIPKTLKFVLCYIFILFLPCHLQSQAKDNRMRLIVIDAGHGGKDCGAIGKITKEKEVTLAIALKLGKYINENMPEIKVIYTRDKDVFIPLHERADIANNNNADLFISVHANANPNTNIQGAETFAMGLHKSEGNMDVAKRENAVILIEDDYTKKYEGFDPNSAESYIIFSLLQNTHLYQSLEFASFIQTQFRERIQRMDRGVKQAGFLVLWKTSMPSVLIEVGFISNKKEEEFITSDEGQDYLASAIYRSVKEYKNAIENKSQFDHLSGNSSTSSNDKTYSTAPEFPKPIINTNTTDLSIRFHVQILNSTTAKDTNLADFKGIKNIIELKQDAIFKYVVGNETDFAKTQALKNSLVKQFPDAFIIATKGDQIISLQQAINNK